MYTNVPITDVKSIINEVLDRNNVNESEKEEILNVRDIIFEQNYIQINEQYYMQNESLPVRVPTSAVLAETYIQHLEDTSIIDILNKHQNMHYYRYVDGILIICNGRKQILYIY
jgi:hypothetical protein